MTPRKAGGYIYAHHRADPPVVSHGPALRPRCCRPCVKPHLCAQGPPHCLSSVYADGHMVLHVRAPQAVDHVVSSLAGAPAGTVMRISDGVRGANRALLAGAPDVAETQLCTALQGADFVVFIARPSLGDDAVCVTDVLLTDGACRLSPSLADSVAQGAIVSADAKALVRHVDDGGRMRRQSPPAV